MNQVDNKAPRKIRRSKCTDDHDASTPLALSKIQVPAERYAADLDLHDRFQQFANELMRVAFGGVAAIGFLVTLITGKDSFLKSIFPAKVAVPLAISMAAFVLAGGAALIHRFKASDGMFHHIRAIKLLLVREQVGKDTDVTHTREQIARTIIREESRRNAKFRSSERMLLLSGVLLFVGILAFGASVIEVLVGVGSRG